MAFVTARDSWQCYDNLVGLLLNLLGAPHDEQAALVEKLSDTPLPILERFLLQISHVSITHSDAGVRDSLRDLMSGLAGRSFCVALRLSWMVDSVLQSFTAMGLGNRVEKTQDKIESFAINRWGASGSGAGDEGVFLEVARKEMRLKLYDDMRSFFAFITSLSTQLCSIAGKQKRQAELRHRLLEINRSLSTQLLIFPIGNTGDPVAWIVRIAVDDCIVLSSRVRVPFLLFFEVITDDTTTMCDPTASELRLANGSFKFARDSNELLDPLEIGDAFVDGESDENGEQKPSGKSQNAFFGAATEIAGRRQARMRKKSPFGIHPNWGVSSVVVKSGDDLRQEEFALQLIGVFNQIWKDAGLTCFVLPYRIIPVDGDSGLIEYLCNASSIDTIKKSHQVSSLAEFFVEAFGPTDSEGYSMAKRNFVETMAGYSIVSYMLQVKDRHNGNLLMTTEGHLVHIDFGFMFVTSPGGLNFESAPFKLSHELLEVMGGVGSAAYNYFKVLLYQGMVAIRNRADYILGLVSLMTTCSTMACLGNDPAVAVEQLRSRFRFDLKTEADFALYVKSLILESVDNWRTRRYDQFQTIQNGIL